MTWKLALGSLLGSMAAVKAAQARQDTRIRALGRLVGSNAPCQRPWEAADEASVPGPVRRYLAMASVWNTPPPRLLQLRQHGELRTAPTSGRWLKFTATQRVAPLGQAFFWNARVGVLPGIHVRVLDSLIDGIGAGQVLLQSALAVGHDRGTPEMNSGALHRFLAEAVWYPWALVPGEHLAWSAIDDRRALATLIVGALAVSLEFRFGTDGEVAGIFTPGRWGSFGGRYEQVAWEGRFADYARWNGVLAPRRGEVGWYRGGRLEPVWKGFIDEVSCEPSTG